MKIQTFFIPQQLKTYSQVLTITREVEQGLEKKQRDKMQKKSVKRPSQLMEGEGLYRPLNASLAKQPLWPLPQYMIRGYCLKPGHYKRECRMENRLYLACGAGGHLIKNCPIRRTENIALIRAALLVPPVRRNPRPIDRRTPFLPLRYFFNQAQRKSRVRTGDRKEAKI